MDVLVATETTPFGDDLVDALRQKGALVVSIEELAAMAELVEAGFRPDAVVIDGVLPDASDLVRWMRWTGVAGVPLVEVAPAPSGEPSDPEVILVRRNVPEIVAALDRACDR